MKRDNAVNGEHSAPKGDQGQGGVSGSAPAPAVPPSVAALLDALGPPVLPCMSSLFSCLFVIMLSLSG
ncbi:hypothetical protein EON65_50905 [archaeon]|nr:MAG: hypothetical protein EON65_50905 [archaeon]